ncbi:MAG: sel1 repeat family protein, partial [Lachnospiraceae bacterium]|nr:sel1 repeat family protein [Lachnospiraceae bacterium]
CFCIGSASGIFESQYKMADMLLEGKGCIQSKIAGARMILSIYAENRMNFCARHYDCKFADVALRVGGLFERGDGLDMDLEMAYTYYLEARCAIRRRRMHFDHFGDAKVEARIEESLARVKSQLPKEYFENDDIYDRPVAIGALLRNSDGMDITLSSKGAYYCITGEAYESTEVSGCTLLVLPRRDFSELVCAVTMRLSPDAKVDKVDLPYQAFISDISGIEGERLVKFQYRNMSMLEVECDYFLVEGCTVVED